MFRLHHVFIFWCSIKIFYIFVSGECDMIPEYEECIHVRIPTKHREQIEALIKAGKFKSLSQVVREALKRFLESEA